MGFRLLVFVFVFVFVLFFFVCSFTIRKLYFKRLKTQLVSEEFARATQKERNTLHLKMRNRAGNSGQSDSQLSASELRNKYNIDQNGEFLCVGLSLMAWLHWYLHSNATDKIGYGMVT